MKKYSSNRAQKGKTAYRTPSPFKVARAMEISALRNPKWNAKIKKASKFKHTNI
jgi:hypothetical protein